jgi:hypothetical protein
VIDMQKWEELSEKFSHVTDKIGRPIDEGILETFVALNALDIPTSMSCEGHHDHGLPYPWVDIESEETMQLMSRHEELTRLEQMNTPEAIELRTSIERRRKVEELKVFEYLTAFYQVQRVDLYRLIIVRGLGMGCTRIQSQGGDFLELLVSEDEKERMLHEYQEEIRHFTAFLKSIYFDFSHVHVGD